MPSDATDKWASWLLHRRDGDDEAQHRKALEHLTPVRDRVLDGGQIDIGDTLLDVGAGDGLIAFGAIDRVGAAGHVIFSDVSADLVDHAEKLANDLGVAEQMTFVIAEADDLSPIEDTSVDVVTTRSVLIYVDDKAAALRAFYRVLKPGGRASIFEPINNYFPWDASEFWGFDTEPVRDLVEKIWHYEGWNEPDDGSDPMMNFNTKDLVRHAEVAGFSEVHVDLRVDVEPGSWVVDYERLLNTAPNPNAHTVGEDIRGALSVDEAQTFEKHLRPLVDAGKGIVRTAFAYLTARKS